MGIDVPRWVFHTGWPAYGPPDGVVMVRADVYASTECSMEFGLFTVFAPGVNGDSTGASRPPATGSRSGSDPVAASEKEHPLNVDHCIKPPSPAKTPGSDVATAAAKLYS